MGLGVGVAVGAAVGDGVGVGLGVGVGVGVSSLSIADVTIVSLRSAPLGDGEAVETDLEELGLNKFPMIPMTRIAPIT